MTKTGAWPLNGNALGMMFSMWYIAFFGDQPRSIGLGFAMCMIWCTTQICEAISAR